MLKPLLHVLLAAGITGRELSRICSGIVDRLSASPNGARIRPRLDREPLEHIVARWTNKFPYMEDGEPVQLRLKGRKPSFVSLVKSTSSSYPPSLALRNLRRSGVVKLMRNGKLKLISRFYPVRSSGAVDIELFTRMMTDFLRTHEFNLLKNPTLGHGLFQRVAHNLNSDARLAPTFNKYVRDQGQLFLETIDEWLVRHQPRKASGRQKKRVRLGVGIYVINEALR
jgi:hypothetical protein